MTSCYVVVGQGVVDQLERRGRPSPRQLTLRVLEMEAPLTPYQKKTGVEPGTKSAAIRLLARRSPYLTAAEIAEEVSTTPAYAGQVLTTSQVSLRELRQRKRRDEAIKKSRLDNRNRAIIADAKSGLFTSRQLQERHEVDRETVRTLLEMTGSRSLRPNESAKTKYARSKTIAEWMTPHAQR